MKKLVNNTTKLLSNGSILMNKAFEYLCTLPQKELKLQLSKYLENTHKEVINKDGFLYAKGTFPVLLVAHLDTVHDALPKKFVYKNGTVSSPQGIGGDDRCGIYIILNILKKFNCSVVFCEDEEIGAIGASKFVKEDFVKELDYYYIIELDRKGSNDAVFYDCDNDDFEDFITEDGDWKTNWGSFSDISKIAPALGIAAVNLSSGYYNAHTKAEYVDLNEMENCIGKVCRLLERTTEENRYEYIEAKRYIRGGYLYNWDWEDDETTDSKGYNSSYYTNDYSYQECLFAIIFLNEKGEEDIEELYAHSDFEAIGIFLSQYKTLTYENIIDVENWGVDDYVY